MKIRKAQLQRNLGLQGKLKTAKTFISMTKKMESELVRVGDARILISDKQRQSFSVPSLQW